MREKPTVKQTKKTLKNVMKKFKSASPQAQESVLEKLVARIETAKDDDLKKLLSAFKDVLETLKTEVKR